ncbi:MAG: phage shock protein C, PspC [Candidatus Parvibacillus calidus]|nr:MAG: phage shock protein C, PspC [Candidatus Parvibacillus calidus]WKZ62898.1 MAG: PspC domain-containing protein [Saprospiraceae bacterium]
MNKTININLGGFPFTMDDDAYMLMERYLNAIKNHFAVSDSYQEIMSDIESRLGELLHDKVSSKAIVTTADVEHIIKIMGRPEEFGAEAIDLPGEGSDQGTSGNPIGTQRTRRLFRNLADKKLGGVCSGLAAYLGIKNANWIRLLFIILASSGGFGIPLYVIMWIFVPPAKTSADYLAMKGEDINIHNIAEFLETEIKHFSNQVTDFAQDISQQFSNKGKKSFRADRPSIDLEETFRSGTARLVSILRPFGLVLGGIFTLIFLGFWITLIVSYILAFPLLGFINSTSPIINFLTSLNSIVIFAVPVVFVIFWALKIFFKTPVHRSIRQSLAIFWISNLICFILLSALTFREFKSYGAIEVKQDLGSLKDDQINISAITPDHRDGRLVLGDMEMGNDNQLEINDNVRFNIYPTNGPAWSATKRVTSRGKDGVDAKKNADCVSYAISPKDAHTLDVPTFFSIRPDCKYRFQQVEIDLFIPIGKYVTFPESLEWRLSEVKYDEAQMPNGWKFIPGKRYKMSEMGLTCDDCTDEELTANMHADDYEYISQEDIPANAVVQSTEKEMDIALTKDQLTTVSFDKIMNPTGHSVKFSKINLNIDQSMDDKVRIIRKLKFYSHTPIAEDQLDKIYGIRQNGNDLIFSNTGLIFNDKKAFNPEITIKLLIPVGTKISFDENVNEFVEHVKFDKEKITDNWHFLKNEVLEMGPKGLYCTNCND